jgi:hypothetical protein
MATREGTGIRLKRGRYKAVAGEHYGTPKEVWGFRSAPGGGSPEQAARRFLSANSALFGLDHRLAGLGRPRVLRSLGASHVIFNQRHAGHRVHRGYVTVHMDGEGRAYLAKNRAVPVGMLPEKFRSQLSREQAVRRARRSLRRKYRRSEVADTERLWFPKNDQLVPAWKVRIVRHEPREEWIVYVDARSGALLSKYDNLSEAQDGLGMVFDPNPVTALGDYRLLLKTRKRVLPPPPVAYRQVKLLGLDGGGTLSGENVTTKPTRMRRIRRANLQFLLQSNERGFEEVMVYYHVDAARRYIESLGYRGPRAIFDGPVAACVNGTRLDNSWYSPTDKMLTFGTGDIDDAEDAETILHEFGHAIQDAICHDFGQSPESAAMGEGFGDYWAASFCESKKPARYSTSVMSWDGLFAGLESRLDPPCLRRVDDTMTYARFDRDGDEHDNGQLWSATLWEVRALLGREKADRLILESHFQLDGFTTFARGARAILDADRNLERGRHVKALARIFRKRRIGPL